MFGEYISYSSSLCSLLHYPVTSSFLGPNISLSTLFSNILNLCCSLNLRDQVSYPYKIRQNYSSVYLDLYIFGCQLKDKRFLSETIFCLLGKMDQEYFCLRITFRNADFVPRLGRESSVWLLMIQGWFDWIFRSRTRRDRTVGLNMGPWHGEEQKSRREGESVATRQIGFVTSKQT